MPEWTITPGVGMINVYVRPVRPEMTISVVHPLRAPLVRQEIRWRSREGRTANVADSLPRQHWEGNQDVAKKEEGHPPSDHTFPGRFTK